MQNEIAHDRAFEFFIAGNCRTVIHNETSKEQRKFHIKARYKEPVTKYEKIDKHNMDNVICYYVYNYIDRNGSFLGTINKESMKFFEKGTKDIELSRNFAWVWHNTIERTLPPDIHILHLGQCAFCGRPLHDAFSLERGIGPVCYNMLFPPKPLNNEHINLPSWGNRSISTSSNSGSSNDSLL